MSRRADRVGRRRRAFAAAVVALLAAAGVGAAEPTRPGFLFNDSHFHLTNYIQEGPTMQRFLEIMGDKVGRVAIFGIPLQQQWSHRVTGDVAPTYYLDTDADLYYYAFTDAWIAMAYLSLTAEQRARFEPMITGFNPADMYAADHIRRVLQTFPGVFTGIGEFTIHKEFVSSKVAGDVASLNDPALDRILDFAGEVGLVVILHNDIAVPFAKTEKADVFVDQARDLLRRHPRTTIIWAHTGLGRVIQPLPGHLAVLESILKDPGLAHVYFDLAWDQVAKYVVATPEAVQRTAALIERFPDRFLFGTDEVAPPDQAAYLRVFYQYEPLWKALSPAASEQVRMGNFARLFDAARPKVRAWEKANPGPFAVRSPGQ